jgi:RES domain
MSSSIWMQCAGGSELRSLRLEPWRVVESQHQISTRKLVDSDAEQQVLEQLIDEAKPPDRTGGRLHYLLFTPFRYPPLRHGSRFGARTEPSIWYGSESLPTAFAEVAYYRLLFLEGTRADLGMVQTGLTAFRITAETQRGIDLTQPPFAAHAAIIASPVDYTETQLLGKAMREAGVELFRYPSARDRKQGVNIGVFVAAAFGKRQPRQLELWHCTATRDGVELTRRDYFERALHWFARTDFLIDGTLPSPAL